MPLLDGRYIRGITGPRRVFRRVFETVHITIHPYMQYACFVLVTRSSNYKAWLIRYVA